MNDYRLDPNYAACTDHEKIWFDHFLQYRDLEAATYAAFNVSNKESARTYGRTVKARKHIAALIQEYCTPPKSMPTLDELKQKYLDIAELANATPREKLMALNSYERLCGFAKNLKPTVPEDEYDPLDDIKD